MLVVLAIVLGPFIWATVYGIRHRNSGAPKANDTQEAEAMIQVWKDNEDIRHWGQSR